MSGYFFISGVKRSATTFLHRLFDCHPQLNNTVYENYIYEYLYGLDSSYQKLLFQWFCTAETIDIIDNIYNRQLMPAFKNTNIFDASDPDSPIFKFDFDRSSFAHYLDDAKSTWNQLSDVILSWYKSLGQIRPWSEHTQACKWLIKCADYGKTINYAYNLGHLEHAVFLVRDPVHVANSLKKRRIKDPFRNYHVFELVQMCRSMEKSAELISPLGKSCTILRYEDFIESPESFLAEICKGWGIIQHDCLQKPTLLGKPWRINTSFRNIDNRSIVLTEPEQKLVIAGTVTYRRVFSY